VWQADAKGETGPNFLERVSRDPEVQQRLSQDELRDLVSLDRHMEHVDAAYRRAGLES
jgi:hypothetical protein